MEIRDLPDSEGSALEELGCGVVCRVPPRRNALNLESLRKSIMMRVAAYISKSQTLSDTSEYIGRNWCSRGADVLRCFMMISSRGIRTPEVGLSQVSI